MPRTAILVRSSAVTTRTSSGRQSPTAHSGSGSPHNGWEPTGCRVSPSVPVAPAEPNPTAPAAVLLHPTNHRIDASTGCGQPVHGTNRFPMLP
ncbi:hypothetical protein SGRIM128S_03880 [Streptomyces griseomycini]